MGHTLATALPKTHGGRLDVLHSPRTIMSNSLSLDLYWNPDRGDNFVTATKQGRDDAASAGYALVRREAFLFPAAEPGVTLTIDPPRRS